MANTKWKQPASITAVRITKYADNGQTLASVTWSDGADTTGAPDGLHMKALIAAAKRNGVKVVRDTAGWLPEAA